MKIPFPIPGISIVSNAGDTSFTDEEITRAFVRFPEHIRRTIAAYSLPAERRVRSISTMLLLEMLHDMDPLHLLTLDDLRRTEQNKPFFRGFSHSSAHCAPLAVCVGSQTKQVGIDLERIRPLHLDNYTDYLSRREYASLRASRDPFRLFYLLWTRKEAFAKLLGVGVSEDFRTFDMLDTTLHVADSYYHCIDLDLAPGYCCSVVYSE